MILVVAIILFGVIGFHIRIRIIRLSAAKKAELGNIEKEIIEAGKEGDRGIPNIPGLERRRRRLQRQIARLDTARSLTSRWRSWHTYLSALFLVSVLIHVAGMLYFGGIGW